jgi:hypothetical protein
LYTSGRRVELLFERIDGTKVAFERRFELAILELATAFPLRSKILPEE